MFRTAALLVMFMAGPAWAGTTDSVDHYYNLTVQRWSRELRDLPSPEGRGGNCTPVAVELQRRIVKSGRMALLVVVKPDTGGPDHLLVLYSSCKKCARTDSLIDNGWANSHIPIPKVNLTNGSLGKFRGYCQLVKHDQTCILHDSPYNLSPIE